MGSNRSLVHGVLLHKGGFSVAMTHAPAGRRSGFGVVFMLALGIIVVASVFLMSQMQVQRSTGREIGAMALGSRASLASDSCITEASYRLAHGAGEEDDEAYELLRSFRQGETLETEHESLFTGAREYRLLLPLSSPLTRKAYEAEADLKIGRSQVGVIERKGYPGESELQTFDHRGRLAFEQQIRLDPPYRGFSMEVTGRYVRAYRAQAVTVPPPFSRFAAVFGDDPRDNPMRRFYQAWKVERDRLAAAGNPESSFTAFPIADFEEGGGRAFVTSSPVTDASGWAQADALANAVSVSDLNSQIELFARAGWRRASPVEDLALREHGKILSTEGLTNRSTAEVENMADLAGYYGEGEVLSFSGTVHVKGPIVLDHVFEGNAVLWTDSSQGIRISRLETRGAGSELVLVASQGNIKVEGSGAKVAAALIAPYGTIQGLAGTTVSGHLVAKGFPADLGLGPNLQMPSDPPRFRPEPGRPLSKQELQTIQILFDPGFVRKDSKRRRISGLLGG